MDKVSVRFECLKLAASQTRDHEETLSRAKLFESFIWEAESVVGSLEAPLKLAPKGSSKKSGNSDPLS